MRGSEQAEEIKTIRERNVVLKLSDADVKRISEKAGAVGLTVAELFENFVGDLVCGTYDNGSDERDFANRWFERCGFSWMNDDTFLKYLIDYSEIEDFVEDWDEIKWYEQNPEDLKEDKETYDMLKERVDESFSDYAKQLERHEKEMPNFEDEMKLVMKWWAEYKTLKGDE